VLLLGAILDTPGLAERLLEALRPDLAKNGDRHGERHRRAANPEGKRTR
jgi:hypothetical protein